MIRQRFTLEKYDWEVMIYYAVDDYYTEEIMGSLYEIGCRGDNLQTAYNNLSSGQLDTGLTYSNYQSRQSVIVIGMASSPEQFINSFEHETFHLKQHIAKAFDLDVWGEEIAYLSGDIAQKMFPKIKLFICACGKKEINRLIKKR